MNEQQETTRDPRAIRAQEALQEQPKRWPWLRQNYAVVLVELLEYRADNGIDDLRPDSDVYREVRE